MNAVGPATPRRAVLPAQAYVDGIRARDRAVLARAITLVESTRADHEALAQEVLLALLPEAGRSVRLGISGVPGVGKSTFIETFGMSLVERGRRVAVLAVDPTSPRTGGSVLGDKTRMPRLSLSPAAFVRPSPTTGTLGGVARRTREAMLLCEAAGYDVVIIETVGVGQSETTVAAMVDFFLVLMLASAGDELQGIKRGILELADLIAINKVDAEPPAAVNRALADYRHALRIVRGGSNDQPQVQGCSGRTGEGIDQIWSTIEQAVGAARASGAREERRSRQLVSWLWSAVESTLVGTLHESPAVAAIADRVESDVVTGQLTPALGAARLLEAYWRERLPR